MAGAWRVLAGVVVGILLCEAPAFGGECWYPAPAVTYYYYPPVYYYYPRVLAVPDAAPASSKAAPQKTISERAPEIIVTRGANSATSPSKDRLKIGFWNLTGHDITLTVGGKARTLAKNRSLSLELEREFSWQVDHLPTHSERVPDGLAVHEVVIRD
jgi:hypothetical protein